MNPASHPIAAAPPEARLALLGWRERIGLPALGLRSLKAKLDTGARTSSLHVDSLEAYRSNGADWLRFRVSGRRSNGAVECTAPALDRRPVTDSGGHRSERWFIRTELLLAGHAYAIDINLTDRRAMLFPVLLGRSALLGRFAVDPALSYTHRRLARSTP